MAAGKTNFPDKNSGDKLDVNTSFNQHNHEKEKTACENDKNRRIYSSFTLFDAAFVLFSMGTFLVDMATDLWVGFHYFSSNEPIWGSLTLAFVVVPCIVMQVFSIRWHIVDDNMKGCFYWTIHFLLMGPIHRYVMVLKAGWRARMTHEPEDFDIYYHRQNDVCMLRLFESFIESAPQLLLQLYIMVYTDHTNWLTGCSASISLISLAWAIAAYTKAMRQAHQDNYRVFWPGMILQTIWRIGMVSARVIALVMFASVYQAWLILVLGVHWLTMTIWIILQKTDFCQSWWEEKLFNCICGMIYCFCFFNLKEGQSRWRMLGFYTVMLLENCALLAAWYLFRIRERWYDQFLLGAVPVAFTVGLMCMLMYYRLCHPSGPIDPCAADTSADIESTDCDDYNKPSGDPASGIIRRMTLKTTRPTCAKIEKRQSANSSFSDYSPLKDSLENDQIGIGQSNHSENCSERDNGSDKDRDASEKHFIRGTKLGFGLHGCFRPQDTVLSLVTDESFQGNGSNCSLKEDNKNRLSQNCMAGLLQEKSCGQPPDIGSGPCIDLDGHEGMKMTEDKSPEVQMFSNQVNKIESQLKVSSESDGCITLRKVEISNPESKFAHDKNTSTLPHQMAEKCTVVNLSNNICNERQVTESLPPNEGREVGVKTDVGEKLMFQMPEPLPPFSGPGPVPSSKYQTFSDKLQCQGKPKELGYDSFYSKSLDTENFPQVAQLNEVESCPKLEIALTESSKQALPIELELCVTSENMLPNGSEIHSKTESNAPVGEKATNVRLMSGKRKSSLYSIVCTPPTSSGLCKNASGKPTEVVPKLIIKEGASCNTVEPHAKSFPSRVPRNFHCSSENLSCDDRKLSRANNMASLTKRFYSNERLDAPGHENQLQNVVGSRCNSPAASQLQKSRQSSAVQSLLFKNLEIGAGKKVSGENDTQLKLSSNNDIVGEKINDSLSVGEGKENVKPSSSALVAGGMIKKGVAFAGEEISRRRRTPLKDDTKFRKTRQAHQSLVAIKPETVAKALSMFGDK